MATKLPHPAITPIGQDRPAAIPELWNSRYEETDENFRHLAEFAPSGVCGTSADNAKKTANCADFVLADGAFFIAKIVNANIAANPSLNVNSTGAKPIYYKGAPIAAEKLSAGCVLLFRYDDNNWDVVGNVDDNELISNGEIDQIFSDEFSEKA